VARAAYLTPQERRRLVRGAAAGAVADMVIYVLVVHVALPALETRLTRAQVEWLRQAFVQHPLLVLGAIVAIAALLALPVLGAFRWAHGPLRRPSVGRSA